MKLSKYKMARGRISKLRNVMPSKQDRCQNCGWKVPGYKKLPDKQEKSNYESVKDIKTKQEMFLFEHLKSHSSKKVEDSLKYRYWHYRNG